MTMEDEQMNLDYYYKNEKITQSHFFRMPKALMKEESLKKLSSDAKLLYTLMLDRMALSMKNGWIDKEGRVFIYYAVQEIAEELDCSNTTCTKILCELDNKKGIGLIERKRQGQGKPDIIYVKNLVESRTKEPEDSKKNKDEEIDSETMLIPEPQKCSNQKSKNRISRFKERHFQEVKKLCPNNTNINNTKYNKNESIYPSKQKIQDDEMDKIQEYQELIQKNIEYDFLLQYSNYGHKELVKELYQLICDVVCVPRKTIRISKCEMFYDIVKTQFLKLNRSHIEYVMEKLDENTNKIRNIKAYLLTALYNAPMTINSYFRQRVQHDMYGGSDIL